MGHANWMLVHLSGSRQHKGTKKKEPLTDSGSCPACALESRMSISLLRTQNL
jgi:hypothetical protein